MNRHAQTRDLAAALILGLVTATGHAANYWWNGTAGANYTSQNWESPSGTPTTATPGGWDRIYNTKGGKVILTNLQEPGYFQFASGELEILAGGTLRPPGNGGASIADGPATLTINGGTLTGNGPTGARAAGATLNLRAGTWTSTGGTGAAFYSSGGSTTARVNHTGGTLAAGAYNVIIGQQDAWGHVIGEYYLGDAAGSTGTFTGSGSLIVGNITNKMDGSAYQRTTYGTFRGWGTVGLTGTLRNNGYIITDGYGQDRTLNFSSVSAVANTVDNNEYKLTGDNNFYWGRGNTGWFAVNGGKLVLPSITVSTGPGAYNWGEAPGDTAIDLINSVRVSFADVSSAGSLSIALLAGDRTDVPAGLPSTVLSLFDITTTATFNNADLTFRYDSTALQAAGLHAGHLALLHYNGTAWDPVSMSLDTANFRLTASGVTSFSMFALVPEPAALALLGLGALALLKRQRQRKP